MRTIFLLFLFTFPSLWTHASNFNIGIKDSLVNHHNKIDEITSEKEIETLLVMVDERFKNFKVNNPIDYKYGFKDKSDTECKYFNDSLKPRPWVRADFDGNGYTDLLVVGWRFGHSVICILDRGENNFFINTITRKSFQGCTFPIVSIIENEPIILNYSINEPDLINKKYKRFIRADTLIFRFGDFVEFNSKSVNHKIEKIEFKTGECYGKCPIFGLTINSNQTATYTAIKYNEKKGKYTAIIDTSIFNQLVGILNYINFETLKSEYRVDWTDDRDCNLKITYDNGKTKNIYDYGQIGTYGLNGTYRILHRLRENQKWKRKWL